MSVYQGFATRVLEQSYNKQLVNLIKILQRRIMKFYMNEKVDEDAFRNVFEQTFQKLAQVEDSKYHEPFYSLLLDDLCNHLSVKKGSPQTIRLSQSNQTTRWQAPTTCCCKCHLSSLEPEPFKSTFLTNLDNQKKKNISQDNFEKTVQTPVQSRPKFYSNLRNPPQYLQKPTKRLSPPSMRSKSPGVKFIGPNVRSPYNLMTFSLNGKKYKHQLPKNGQNFKTTSITVRTVTSTPSKRIHRRKINDDPKYQDLSLQGINHISNPNESNA